MKNTNIKVLTDSLGLQKSRTTVAECNDHIVELVVEPKAFSSGLGSYHHSDWGIYVLEGSIELSAAGGKQILESGSFATVPHMQAHQISSKSKAIFLSYIRDRCEWTPENSYTSTALPAVINVVDKASSKNTDHCNFVIANINDHEVRLGIHKGDYNEHHHSNSDECFLFLEGKYFLAHMLGEEELECFDFVSVNKLEAHKPYMPKRTYLLYFHKKGIRTVNYEGSELNFFTDV